MSNVVLAHHGIRGMKWGRRRYQNEDGTLTPEGKARYGEEGDSKSRARVISEKAKAAADKAFDQRIKTGKDKAPISPAEKVSKETSSAFNEASKLAGGIAQLQGTKKIKGIASPKNMTDADLKTAVERLRMEKAYRELASADIESGASHVKDIIDTIGAGVGVATSIISIIAAINNAKKG